MKFLSQEKTTEHFGIPRSQRSHASQATSAEMIHEKVGKSKKNPPSMAKGQKFGNLIWNLTSNIATKSHGTPKNPMGITLSDLWIFFPPGGAEGFDKDLRMFQRWTAFTYRSLGEEVPWTCGCTAHSVLAEMLDGWMVGYERWSGEGWDT